MVNGENQTDRVYSVFSVVNGVLFTAPPYNFSVGQAGLTSLSSFYPLHHRRGDIWPTERLHLRKPGSAKSWCVRARVSTGTNDSRCCSRCYRILRVWSYRALPNSLVRPSGDIRSCEHGTRLCQYLCFWLCFGKYGVLWVGFDASWANVCFVGLLSKTR